MAGDELGADRNQQAWNNGSKDAYTRAATAVVEWLLREHGTEAAVSALVAAALDLSLLTDLRTALERLPTTRPPG